MISEGTEVIVKHIVKSAGNFVIALSRGRVTDIVHSSIGPLYRVEYHSGSPADWVGRKGLDPVT